MITAQHRNNNSQKSKSSQNDMIDTYSQVSSNNNIYNIKKNNNINQQQQKSTTVSTGASSYYANSRKNNVKAQSFNQAFGSNHSNLVKNKAKSNAQFGASKSQINTSKQHNTHIYPHIAGKSVQINENKEEKKSGNRDAKILQNNQKNSEIYKKKIGNCKKLVHQIEYQIYSNSKVKILKKCRICNVELDNPNICAFCTIFFCNNCQFYCQQVQNNCPVKCEFWSKQEQMQELKQNLIPKNLSNSTNNNNTQKEKNSQETIADSIQNIDEEKIIKNIKKETRKIEKKNNFRKLVSHKYKEFITKQKQTQMVFSSLQNIEIDSESESNIDYDPDYQQQDKKNYTKKQNNSDKVKQSVFGHDSEGDMENQFDVNSSKSSIMQDQSFNQEDEDKEEVQLHALSDVLKYSILNFEPKKGSKKSKDSYENMKNSLVKLQEDPQYQMNLDTIREKILNESESNVYNFNGSYQESQKFLREKLEINKKNTQGCCNAQCTIF